MRGFVALVLVAGCGFSAGGGSASSDGAPSGDDQPVHDGDVTTPDAPIDAPVTMGDWWDSHYQYRARILVLAGTAIPANYAVSFTADTANLVTNGRALASGSDWRIVRHTNTGWQEIDRWVDDAHGAFNTNATITWFRNPVALAQNATDNETYVYFGGGAAVTTKPPQALSSIFTFGDDFEGDLTAWSKNGRGEVITQDTDHSGGAKSMKLVFDGTAASGLHRDMDLPIGVYLFSTSVRQAQINSSFGVARAFEVPYAMRQPTWVESSLRLGTELDSGNHYQIWADNDVLDNWYTNVGTDWHTVDTVIDLSTNSVKVRADGGQWHGPDASRYKQNTGIKSLGLEGENGQPGTFYLDNFIIRPYVPVEPTATLLAVETIP